MTLETKRILLRRVELSLCEKLYNGNVYDNECFALKKYEAIYDK